MNAQREECSSESQQDAACPGNICGPSHASRDGAETCLCQEACHDSPITRRETSPKSCRWEKVQGNFFFFLKAGLKRFFFMIWAMGFLYNRHGKAHSLKV